mgnify:CR=1 FL=1
MCAIVLILTGIVVTLGAGATFPACGLSVVSAYAVASARVSSVIITSRSLVSTAGVSGHRTSARLFSTAGVSGHSASARLFSTAWSVAVVAAYRLIPASGIAVATSGKVKVITVSTAWIGSSFTSVGTISPSVGTIHRLSSSHSAIPSGSALGVVAVVEMVMPVPASVLKIHSRTVVIEHVPVIMRVDGEHPAATTP